MVLNPIPRVAESGGGDSGRVGATELTGVKPADDWRDIRNPLFLHHLQKSEKSADAT